MGCPSEFDSKLRVLSILGPGEATHGQHESLEPMHLVTVHLIRTLVSRAPPYSAPEDRVHLIGFDVHDPKECAQLMSAIAGPDFVYVATRAVDLVDGLDSAVQGLWSGNPAPCLANKEKIEALAASVAAREQQTPRALPLGHFGRLADGTKRLTSA